MYGEEINNSRPFAVNTPLLSHGGVARMKGIESSSNALAKTSREIEFRLILWMVHGLKGISKNH